MNVYEKLNTARLYFMNSGVKKSRHNDFANYDYFELSDILPVVNRAAEKWKFCVVVKFGQEEAMLDFIDIEKPDEKITFTSPMSTANLKNNHAVQNLGAVETYIRRYLYLTAFEIVECDALDATTSTATKPHETAKNYTQEQSMEMKKIFDSVYPNGEQVFTSADKDRYRQMLTQEGGEASLTSLKKEFSARLEAYRRGA